MTDEKLNQTDRTLRERLLDPAYWQARLADDDVGTLMAEWRAAPPEDEELALIQSALEMSAHVLACDKAALAAQLEGRLWGHRARPALQPLMKQLAGTSGFHPLNAALAQAGGYTRTLEGHTSAVAGLLALTDRRLLSWAGHPSSCLGGPVQDHTLRLWSAEGEQLRVLEGHTGAVTGALELGNGRLLSWCGENVVVGYDLDAQRTAPPGIHPLRVAYPDTTLRLWSAEGQPLRILEGHTVGVTNALALADGRLLSWSWWPTDHTLRLWSAEGEPLHVLEGHTDYVKCVLALADGRLLSWSSDHTLRLWSAEGEPLRVLEGHTEWVNGALALADGRLLSWSGDHTLRLWSVEGEPLCVLEGHTDGVTDTLALSDGRLLSWASGSHPAKDRTLRLWSMEGEPLRVLEGHTDRVAGALALADGRLLSWSDDRSLRLWSADGEPLCVLKRHLRSISGALELADGRLLSWARGSDSMDPRLMLWSAEGKRLRILEGHTDPVCGVLVLANGQLLSWAGCYHSKDSTLRLWSAEGEPLHTFYGDAPITRCVVLKDDPPTLAAGDQDGRVMFLRLEEMD
jgi:WD40 repeat protein